MGVEGRSVDNAVVSIPQSSQRLTASIVLFSGLTYSVQSPCLPSWKPRLAFQLGRHGDWSSVSFYISNRPYTALYRRKWTRNRARTRERGKCWWQPAILKGSWAKIICTVMHMSFITVYAKFEASCTKLTEVYVKNVKYWIKCNLLHIDVLR